MSTKTKIRVLESEKLHIENQMKMIECQGANLRILDKLHKEWLRLVFRINNLNK